MAKIIGSSKADVLSGSTGGDTIIGNRGDDTLVGATMKSELLVDGSFESAPVAAHTWSHFAQVGGWQSDTGVEVWGKDFIEKASNGDKLMELDYDNKFSKVWQDVKTTAGEEYHLSLDSAMRPGTSAATNAINVFWNGVEVGRIEPHSSTWNTNEFKVVGTGGNDRLEFREDVRGNDSFGGLIDNVSLKGAVQGNVLIGGTGNDRLVAGDNGDVLIGGGSKSGAVDLTKMSMHHDVQAKVHFDTSDAAFHNSVGMYTYDDTGKITSTQMLFGDLSAQGTNGGAPDLSVGLKAGQHIGFFIAPDAAHASDMQAMLKDGGSFHLVNVSDGQTANVNSGQPMQLAFQSTSGQWSNVHTANWTSVFTTNINDNSDGFQHAKVTVDPATGQMHVAFEDQLGGGDKNWLDANFTLDIGKGNAGLMARQSSTGTHVTAENDDTLIGGAGNDTLLGGNGNDTLAGGLGHNVVDGGTGNDHIVAGGGDDTIYGGKGFDTLDFGGAQHGVLVNLAQHMASGFGTDKVYGIEAVVGSAYNDKLVGDKGANLIDGGAGNDLLSGGKGADVLIGGAGNDTFVWARSDVGTGVDHVTDFGKGHDMLDLSDLFAGQKGNHADKVQLVDDVAGSHLMAKIGGSFVEVAMLDNVHHTSAADLLKAGMLLV